MGVNEAEHRTGLESMSLTVVICTHERPKLLRRALSSLAQFSGNTAEIVVVDNAPSNDDSKRVVLNEFSEVRYIREETKGLNVARNRALKETHSDLIAYIDDDAVASDDWVPRIVDVFNRNPELGACTGSVTALQLQTSAQRLIETNGGLYRGDSSVYLPDDAQTFVNKMTPLVAWASTYGVGCNMALRCDVVRAIGGFDEALDRGALLPGGGDIDMFWRILISGHPTLYEPSVHVKHEHRRDWQGANEQIVGHQRALIAFLVKSVSTSKGYRTSTAIYLLWRLLKPGLRLLKRLARQDPLPFETLWLMWRNCFAGLHSYRRTI